MERLGFTRVSDGRMDDKIELMHFWRLLMNLQDRLDALEKAKLAKEALDASLRQSSLASQNVATFLGDGAQESRGDDDELHDRYIAPLDESNILPDG